MCHYFVSTTKLSNFTLEFKKSQFPICNYDLEVDVRKLVIMVLPI